MKSNHPMTTPSSNSNGWVALYERRPTKNDGNKDGWVFVTWCEGRVGLNRYDAIGDLVTHWQPLPPPPESPEQRQARLDTEALEAAWTAENIGGDTGRFANFCKGFRAGAAHARRKEDGK